MDVVFKTINGNFSEVIWMNETPVINFCIYDKECFWTKERKWFTEDQQIIKDNSWCNNYNSGNTGNTYEEIFVL